LAALEAPAKGQSEQHKASTPLSGRGSRAASSEYKCLSAQFGGFFRSNLDARNVNRIFAEASTPRIVSADLHAQRIHCDRHDADHLAIVYRADEPSATALEPEATFNVSGVECTEGRTTVNNSIFVIKPYRWECMWVFDDSNVGLVKEPFVGGADTMIDVATAQIPNAAQGFIAVFSASYFPDAQIVLEWVRQDGGGNVYRWKEKGMEGWLCPALLKYFEEAPAKLFIQVKAAR
jgi:hypothetical protein